MSNVIYRGPVEREPETINLPAVGAYLPGLFVTSDGDELTLAGVGGARVLLLSNRRFYDQGLADAYAAGETAVAYRLRPDDEFQARLAAGTYAHGDALAVDANGRLAAAGLSAVVIAHYNQAGATLSAGDLADVVIANSYVTPAA